MTLVTEDLIRKMGQTSAKLPQEPREFKYTGLTPVESTTIQSPRIAEVAPTLERTLYASVSIYSPTVVFGEITPHHINDSLLTDGEVDATKARAVCHLDGLFYTRID